ncbi:MAG: 16S rRNA (guanine(966)-N(2))-methyltransferase RsmD [Candidatus Omnitrophica bacterium]|nr:16S rRNA (guanine(966)-N(2))-methyltransferase RsmD [Candidatus Omnitrophota bacterium]
MRIIGGTDRGKHLVGPSDQSIRPTPGLVREALFNILQDVIEGAHFLDLYAGTGAVGLEALSRGAASVTFVESSQAAVRLIRANLAKFSRQGDAYIRTTSAPGQCRVFQRDQREFDLIFLDPPYNLPGLPINLLEPILAPNGLVIHQRPFKKGVGDPFKGTTLERLDLRKYGKTELSFWGFPDRSGDFAGDDDD